MLLRPISGSAKNPVRRGGTRKGAIDILIDATVIDILIDTVSHVNLCTKWFSAYLCAYIQLFTLVCSGQASRENCWRNKRQLHQLFRQYVRLRMRRRQLQQFLYVCVCVSACLRPTLLHLVVTKCCALSLFFYSLTLCPCWLAERAQLLCVCVCLFVCVNSCSVRQVLGARLWFLLLLLLCKFACFCLIRSKNRQSGIGE